MQPRRPDRFNPKRKIQPLSTGAKTLHSDLATTVKYGGNPEHKKNPGDFGLTPPSATRLAKSICDTVNIYSRKDAIKYLKNGLEKCMVSYQMRGKWPQNIWAVTKDGVPLEAQLENSEIGQYHGYPMPESDPFSNEVISEWNTRNEKA